MGRRSGPPLMTALPARTPDPPPLPVEQQPTAERESPGEGRLGFGLILVLTAALRLPLLLVTQGFDYWFYRGLGRLSDLGFYPFIHYWVEYPPVFPWLAVGAYRLTLRFPPTLFKDFEASYHAVLGAVLVLADIAAVAVIAALCRRLYPPGEAERRTIFYAILFWPIVVAIGWYDSLPCFLLLLGVWLIVRGQGTAAGATAGLGFLTKVFPAILVPVAVKFLPRRRDRVAAVLGGLAVTLLIAGPLLAISPAYFLASYRAVFARSAWETVWAIAEGYFSYGKVAPLGVRFDPTTAQYVAFRSQLPTLAVTALYAVLYAGFWLRPVARTARNAILFTAISITSFLIYSKGYSPQFLIYVLPFVVILLPWRRAVGYSLALSAFNLLEWPLYHEWFGQVHWVLIIAVVGRTLLFAALCWEWLAELWQLRNPLPALQVSRRAATVATAVLLIAALPASVLAWQTWVAGYYEGSPLRPAFDFVRRYDTAPAERAAFVFADQGLYESFYPFFGGTGDFYLLRLDTSGDETIRHPSLTPEGRQAALAAIASSHRQVFLIRNADDWTSRDLNGWLTDNAQLAAAARAGATDLSVWLVPPPGGRPGT